MGQNSTEVQYGFGQLGSAYCDAAHEVIPPQGMVIVAITFLSQQQLSKLTPEILADSGKPAGPGFPAIGPAVSDTVLAGDNHHFNFNGQFASAFTNGSYNAGVAIPLGTSGAGRIKVGQYVVMVNAAAEADGGPALAYDSDLDLPIYNGPNKRGCRVATFNGTNSVTLEKTGTSACNIAGATGQALVFLDEAHGAGGLAMAGQTFPAGLTIYGRWSNVLPAGAVDGGAIIAYFGY